MFRARNFFSIFLGLAAPAAARQQSVGIFGLWGALVAGDRCQAVAEAVDQPVSRGGRAYASVGFWKGRALQGQVYFRFARPKRSGSAILLRIDQRTFQLRGGGVNAWAADRSADAEIVGAMRTGVEMSVETRAENGALLRDVYRLRGAASAVDAAAIACVRPA